MRMVRIVGEGAAYYHIMSRVVDRLMVFNEGEMELFRKTLRKSRREQSMMIPVGSSCPPSSGIVLVRQICCTSSQN